MSRAEITPGQPGDRVVLPSLAQRKRKKPVNKQRGSCFYSMLGLRREFERGSERLAV